MLTERLGMAAPTVSYSLEGRLTLKSNELKKVFKLVAIRIS